MRFEVPQYIDVEDKIFGPFTFRQFAYMVGGLGLVYLIWNLLPVYFAIPLIIPVGGLSIAMAFVKVNGKPLINVMEAGFMYTIRKKLYLWKKEEKLRKVSF